MFKSLPMRLYTQFILLFVLAVLLFSLLPNLSVYALNDVRLGADIPLSNNMVGDNLGRELPLAYTPQITTTKKDTLFKDVNNNGLVEPGDVIKYTVIITNNGTTDATNVIFNDNIDDNTTLSGTVKTTPLALPDFYSTTGNIGLN